MALVQQTGGMNVIRVAGRWMLASYFIVSGFKSITNPEPLVSDAEPLVGTAIPLAMKAAPTQVHGFIPTDAKTWVRIDGAAQLLGGLGLGTGIGRRLGALLVSAAMAPHVIAAWPAKNATADEKAEGRRHVLRNAALLGGALIASQDLQGKPNLAWRAESAKRQLAAKSERTQKEAGRTTKRLKKAAKRQAKQAKASLADVVPGN